MSTDTFDPVFDDEPLTQDDADYSAPWPPMVRDEPAEPAGNESGAAGPSHHEDTDGFWGPDSGATTAEYAITTLAACGFAALLVIVLKSEPIKELVTGVIQTALGLGS